MKDRRNVSFEYKRLNTKDLLVDDLYQRDIDAKRLMRMVKNYDPCLVNAVKVSFRDGKYYIYDGRHTSAMLKSVQGKGKDTVVDCKVFYGLSRLDEMELFVAQNGESSSVSKVAKLRALYNFGDPDVTGMVQAAQCAGVRVDFTRGQAANKVTAIGTLLKIYMRMPRDQYIDMLSTLRAAWSGIPDSFVREILSGMELFYNKYYGEFNSKDLSKSLSRIMPNSIVREGKSVGVSTSNYARVILRQYNSGRTKHRLEDRF